MNVQTLHDIQKNAVPSHIVVTTQEVFLIAKSFINIRQTDYPN